MHFYVFSIFFCIQSATTLLAEYTKAFGSVCICRLCDSFILVKNIFRENVIVAQYCKSATWTKHSMESWEINSHLKIISWIQVIDKLDWFHVIFAKKNGESELLQFTHCVMAMKAGWRRNAFFASPFWGTKYGVLVKYTKGALHQPIHQAWISKIHQA